MRSAFFLDGVAGSLFCIGTLHAHDQELRRKILIVPPFAEEMNKSRHVLAALSEGLAAGGHDVLMLDLFGTGDSEGDFSEATLDIWRADLDAAIRCLDPRGNLELVGLRAGALLAADAVNRHEVKSLTLLHPLADGRQQLTQLLRLRLAGGLMGEGKKESAAQLRQRLEQGECIEVAGYGLSGRLAQDLESLALKKIPPTGVAQVNWIELASAADRPLMPASQSVIDAWRETGSAISSSVVVCDQFWATQEIARCPGVVRETMKYFAG